MNNSSYNIEAVKKLLESINKQAWVARQLIMDDIKQALLKAKDNYIVFDTEISLPDYPCKQEDDVCTSIFILSDGDVYLEIRESCGFDILDKRRNIENLNDETLIDVYEALDNQGCFKN